MESENELRKKTLLECVSLINLRLRKQEHYIVTEPDGRKSLMVNSQIKRLLCILETEINELVDI